MKRSTGAVAIVVASLLLAGCSGASTPEVTPAPASEPAATEATDAPTAAETAAEDAADDDDADAEAAADAEAEDAVVTDEEDAVVTDEAGAVADKTEPSAGTREAPLAVGEARKLSDDSAWTVSLQASNLDAAEEILAADEWAEPPAEGEVFVVGTFTLSVDAAALEAQGFDLTNDGADPWMHVTVEYVGADGRGYDALTGTMCFTQNEIYNQGIVYEDGASITGDVCLAVPQDQVDGGLWRVSNMMNDSVWMAAD